MKRYCMHCMNPLEDGYPCPHCSAFTHPVNALHQLPTGAVLAGKYLVGVALGQGGFGITYIGRDLTLDTRVAIKEYYLGDYTSRVSEASNQVTVTGEKSKELFERCKQRFLDEARTLERYRRERGFVDVRDYFEENGTAYIVMEYLEGEALQSVVTRGPLPPEWVFGQFLPIMDALEHMHADKVLHRDISPDNVMLLKDGGLRLLDFGAARTIDVAAQKNITVMHKRGYTSIEQYAGDEMGPWTDIYSLCATMYYCITGKRPPDASARRLADGVEWPSNLGISILPKFEAVLRRGMAVEPGSRYRSIAEMRDALLGEGTRPVVVNPSGKEKGTEDDGRTRVVGDGPGNPFPDNPPLRETPPVPTPADKVPVMPDAYCGKCGAPLVAGQPCARCSKGGEGMGGASGDDGKRPAKWPLLVVALLIGVICGVLYATGSLTSCGTDATRGLSGGTLALADVPDAALRQALQDAGDEDGDGVLSQEEASKVTSLDVAGAGVADLTGVEVLANLQALDISDNPDLVEANLGGLPALASFNAVGSGIQELDVSENSQLADLRVEDDVMLSGLEATQLREEWQIVSYSQRGMPDDEADYQGDWSADYTYDAENRLAKVKLSTGDSGVAPVREFAYADDGRLSRVYEYTNAGASMGELRFYYGDREIREERYSASGELQGGHYITLDGEGKVKRAETLLSEFTAEYRYDESNGTLVSVHYSDPSSSYANSFSYDNGRLVEEDDAPSAVARDFRYEYDGQGRCIKRTRLNSEGTKVLREDTYSYDSDGLIQCADVDLEYDGHGNLVGCDFANEGQSTIAYRRVLVPKDADALFQPLDIGDPALAPKVMLPCTINIMAAQDPVAAHHGPGVNICSEPAFIYQAPVRPPRRYHAARPFRAIGETMPDAFDPVEYINTPRWRSSRLGLDRTRELLAGLGNPQDRLRIVHVAGTNGKGSTCAFLASILQAAGYRTGLFTSPYIIEFSDRIRVDGQNIPDADLREVTLAVREVAEAMPDHPTEFELMTAVAFTYFARRACDICVVEVGLGGRLDSTNVVQAPEVCVLAPIALDHTDLLGDTLEAIAAEKAGIVKPGVPVVCAPQQAPAMGVVAAACVERQAPLTCVDADQIQGTPGDFSYRGWQHLQLGLLGSYQVENAATALETVDVLRGRGWNIPDAAVASGLADTYWPGRFEVLGEDPTFIVDGGHNPQGAGVLVESLAQRYPDRPVIFIMGILADKDYPAMVRQLVGYASTRMVICIEPPIPRALPTEELAAEVNAALAEENAQMARLHPLTRPKHEVMVREAISIPAAVEAALGIARDLSDDRLVRDSKADPFAWLTGWSNAPAYVNPIVVACGSLYSVAEITRAYRSLAQ